MTVSSSVQYDDDLHLVLGAFGGGVCVWRFSCTDGLTSCCSDADAHKGTVRSTRFTSNGHLMTAGDDGLIQVINVRKNIRVALLDAHEDQINSLGMVEEDSGFVHAISAANDASIAVWGRMGGRWECKRRMRRHRGPVLALGLHPTGRLALSLGADGTMRTWNLLRGRQAFVVKLKSRPERASGVQWSPDGQRYIVEFPHRVDCYRLEDAQSVDCSVGVNGGLAATVFLSSQILVIASGLQLIFHDVTEEGAEISTLAVTGSEGKRSKIRSLAWDFHDRLLFVLTRHSEGGGLLIYRLPAELISGIQTETADAKAVLLCKTEVPFRVTSFDACRFKTRLQTAAKTEAVAKGSQSKKKSVTDGINSAAKTKTVAKGSQKKRKPVTDGFGPKAKKKRIK